jgi:hypothetical protein
VKKKKKEGKELSSQQRAGFKPVSVLNVQFKSKLIT